MKKILIYVFAIMSVMIISGCTKESTKIIDEELQNPTDEKETVTIDETVLIDTDEYVVRAIDIVNDESLGLGVRIQADNYSDNHITINSYIGAVNNITLDTNLTMEVGAGDRSEEILYFEMSEYEKSNIDHIAKIEVKLIIIDKLSYDVLYNTGLVSINTSEYESFTEYAEPKGTDLYSLDGINIAYIVPEYSEESAQQIPIYIRNDTDSEVFMLIKIAFNGYEIDTVSPIHILKGRVRYYDLYKDIDDFSKSIIGIVDEIEISLFYINMYNDNSTKNSDIEMNETFRISADGKLLESSKYFVDASKDPEGIDGEILYNSEGIRIYYLGLEEDSEGINVRLYADNCSSNRVIIDGNNIVVNDYIMNTCTFIEIGSDKKAYWDILLKDEDLNKACIQTIEEIFIDTKFSIFEDGDYGEYEDEILIINTGNKAIKREETDGQLIMDTKGIKMRYLGVEEDIEDGYYNGLSMYIENTSDQDINIRIEDIKLNNKQIPVSFEGRVLSGKKKYTYMMFDKWDMEVNSIETIEKVEFTVAVYGDEMEIITRIDSILIEPQAIPAIEIE